MNKIYCLDEAVKIIKEHARNDIPKNGTSLATALEEVYEMMKKLHADVNA